MRTINGYFIDRLADWFQEHTGHRPEYISAERSHRGRYFTNVAIKMPESFKRVTRRKQLTLPIQDSLIDGVSNGAYPDELLNFILGGAVRKAGLFDSSQALPETDRYLY